MKKILIALLITSVFTTVSVFAQKETKEEKKPRKAAEKQAKKEREEAEKFQNAGPKMTVVQLKGAVPRDSETIESLSAPVAKPSNGSLFTDGAVNGNLLVDFKARRIGDLVFVDVVEENTATVSSSAKRDRDSGTLGGLVPLINALPVNGAATAGSVVSGLGNRKFEGAGSTQRKSNVQARITARVVEVLPNGDLRIEAVKLVKINKETEKLGLTGIVRQTDLANDNSIETNFIGDLRVEFNGKGIASADNAPGWLSRLFEKVLPF